MHARIIVDAMLAVLIAAVLMVAIAVAPAWGAEITNEIVFSESTCAVVTPLGADEVRVCNDGTRLRVQEGSAGSLRALLEAETAEALAADPVDCAATQFATTIAANGDLTCAALTDADIPDTITVDQATLALTGDSATAFFSAGAIEAARGGTGLDTSASTGVPRVTAGTWSADAGVSHLAASTSAALRGVLSDESGTGAAIFGGSPTDDGVLVGDGTTWATAALTTCTGANKAVTYNASTNAWGCNTISTATPAGSAGDLQMNDGASGLAASGLNYATNVLELRNGTTAQTSRLYETRTDASNYSRLSTGYSSGNSRFEITAEAAGTGTARNLALVAGSGSVSVNTGGTVTAGNANESLQFAGSQWNFTTGGTQKLTLTSSELRANNTGFFKILITQGVSATTPVFIPSRIDSNTGYGSDGTNALVLIAGGTTAVKADADATAGNTRLLVYDVTAGSLRRVSIAGNDTCGSGFRCLRIPN